jgi:hypothetical protein
MAVFFACHLLTSAFAARKLHQTGSAARGAAWSGRPPGGGVRYGSPKYAAISSVRVRRHRMSAGRRGSNYPGRASHPAAGCRETVTRR